MTRRATAVLVLALGIVFSSAPAAHAVPALTPRPRRRPRRRSWCRGLGRTVRVIRRCRPPHPGSSACGPRSPPRLDPFTTAGVSIASVYGTNYQWWAYDNGCGAGSDIMPRLTTNIANVIGLQLPGLLLAIGQGLFTAVIDPSSWIGFLDKPIEHATASVAAGVWFPFLSLALLLVAVVTLLRAARGRLAATITATVWALTVLVLVTWVVGYPTESVKLLDSGIQTAVVATAQGFGPDAQQVGPQAPSTTADTEGSARAAAVARDGRHVGHHQPLHRVPLLAGRRVRRPGLTHRDQVRPERVQGDALQLGGVRHLPAGPDRGRQAGRGPQSRRLPPGGAAAGVGGPGGLPVLHREQDRGPVRHRGAVPAHHRR